VKSLQRGREAAAFRGFGQSRIRERGFATCGQY
jgi:hypothetical protein